MNNPFIILPNSLFTIILPFDTIGTYAVGKMF